MNILRKKIVAFATTMMLVVSLSACGNANQKSNESNTTVNMTNSEVKLETSEDTLNESSEGKIEVSSEEISEDISADVSEHSSESSLENSSEEIGETVYPLTLEDSNGGVLTINEEPMKIISCAPNLTEMLYELGAGDKLVARSDYCDYPEQVTALESVGNITTPDIEKIISLEPDLVLASTHFDEENAKKLNDAGIVVLTLWDGNSFDAVYKMIENLGMAINKNSEAAEAVKEMKNNIANVEAKVENLDKPSVYYVIGYGEYGDYTATGETFISTMIEKAGGDNIVKHVTGWSVTFEEILEHDPTIIIISSNDKDAFMEADNYKELTAVKEGRVYAIDSNMLDRQGTRNDDAVEALAEIFHPEAF